MDISLARQILQEKVTQIAAELEATQLALSVLNDTYAAEFISLTTARAEADALAEKLSKKENPPVVDPGNQAVVAK